MHALYLHKIRVMKVIWLYFIDIQTQTDTMNITSYMLNDRDRKELHTIGEREMFNSTYK